MIPRLPITKALVATLEAGTGKRCGHGRLPLTPAGGSVEPPYLVLYPTDRTVDGPPLGDAGSWAELEYQTTAVGGTRLDQAEWMDDKAAQVLLGQQSTGAFLYPITVAGLIVVGRRLVEGGVADEQGGIVSLTSRYVLTVTGA